MALPPATCAAFLSSGSLQGRVDQGAAVGALATPDAATWPLPEREEVDALLNSSACKINLRNDVEDLQWISRHRPAATRWRTRQR